MASALAGGGGEGGCLDQVVAEVAGAVQGAADAAEAEERNLLHSLSKLRDSAILRRLHETGQLEFAAGIYDIRTGLVRFLR